MESIQKSSNCRPDTLYITPLGGLGEIGLNMMTLEYGDSMIVIDAGLMFPEDYMLGIDVAVPDITYLRENRERIRGIVLTHGHEDHIGALPIVLKYIQVPVYGTGFTMELVKYKLREYEGYPALDFHRIYAGQKFEIGPFLIEPIHVCHSTVDCCGLAVTTPVGTIIHSGDFKIDPFFGDAAGTDLKRFQEYGQKGILALLSDSTNSERKGHSLSERDVEKTLEAIFTECKGRVIMALFSTHIQRIQQAVDLSVRFGRKVVFTGKSVLASVRMAQDLDFLNLPEDAEASISDIDRLPDRAVTIITTGSQAEPLSSITRMAFQQHKQITIRKPDTVILSSSFIPGNVKAITRIINLLYRQGAEVVYETVSDIHASGHAYQDELETMIRITKPLCFIPIHGEYRHLVRHAQLAMNTGIAEERVFVAENGQQIQIGREGACLGQKVPVARILVDGKGVGDVDSPVLKERRRLSEDGIVAALAVVDRETGRLLAPLEIISRGFIQENNEDELLELAKSIVIEEIEKIVSFSEIDWANVTEDIRKRLKKFLYKAVARKPIVLPVIVPI